MLKEDIPIMELFRKTVNESREALAKVKAREELTYHYAVVRVYRKMLVTSCAIYTLLINGIGRYVERKFRFDYNEAVENT